MSDQYSIIKGPVVTEKSATQGTDANKVVFWVEPSASKLQIRDAVEKLFSVKVVNVNTMKIPGKQKRMGRYMGKTSLRKKAYVTLKEGESVEQIFGGGA